MTQRVRFPDPRPAAAPPETLPTVAGIIEATAAAFEVKPRDLLSERRDHPSVSARHAAMWLARRLTLHGYPSLGQLFRRDHSSVMYGVERASARMHDDEKYASRIRRLEATIGRT